MANEIAANFQHKYDNMCTHLLQQKANRLRDFVTVKQCSGKLEHFDQYGLLEFDQKTARSINTTVTNVDAPTTKRVLAPLYFHKSVGFDEFDAGELAQQSVPITETVQAFGFAAGRKMEDIIINGVGGDWGMFGNSYQADDGAAGTPVPFDANNILEAGTTGMSMAKLREGLRILMENEAWGQDSESAGDVCCVAMRAQQISELLADNELTTTDRSDLRSILSSKNGFADIYGIRVIRTQQVPDDLTNVLCPMWVKSKVNFGIWADHRVKLSVRDDLEETIQLRAKFGCNATRMEEGGVAQIECVLVSP